jgi:hypothetical protein
VDCGQGAVVVDGLKTVLVFIVVLPVETIVNQNSNVHYSASPTLKMIRFLG